MRTANCPSCGAPLRFRGATSIVAVCQFCKATLVREGVNLQDIGKQAELLEDQSPLRIGADGKHKGKASLSSGASSTGTARASGTSGTCSSPT